MPAPPAPSWHPHAAVTQWAVAGGLLGHPVHIVFQDYPAPVIGELYRRHVAWLERRTIFSVFGLHDFHRLGPKLDTTRVVLLFDPKQFDRTCWLLDMHRNAAAIARKSSPALFSSQLPTGIGDAPGAVLVVHGYSPQLKSLETWLEREPPWTSFPPDLPLPVPTFDDRLSPLVANQGYARPDASLAFRPRQILKGLLAGAALLRKVQER